MQPEFEVSWHGAKWRDDRVDVVAPPTVTTPQGLSPAKRPHERRGGRKPVISGAVTEILRTAEKPLSARQVYERVSRHGSVHGVKFTIAGVNSAMGRLRTTGQIAIDERRPGYGQFSSTYRWAEQSIAALDAVKLKPTKAEIGRLGGLAKAANERQSAESC